MKRSAMELLIGTTIVLIGIGFLLQNSGVLHITADISSFWPLLIILFGVSGMLSSRKIQVIPAFITVFGIILLLTSTNVIHLDIWNILWPSAIILFGASIFLKNDRRDAATQIMLTDSPLQLSAQFSDITRKTEGTSFQGAQLNTLFGKVTLDMSGIHTKQQKFSIVTANYFGTTELKIPKSCHAVVTSNALFANVENTTAEGSKSSTQSELHIISKGAFSSLIITN